MNTKCMWVYAECGFLFKAKRINSGLCIINMTFNPKVCK